MTTTLRQPGHTRLPPRWAVRTAHLIPLLTLPAMLWRVPLAFGFSMGTLHDGVPVHATGGVAVYVLALAIISEAVALLSLGLVRPWGEGLIRALGVEGGLTRLSYEETLGSAHPSAYTLWSSAAIDVVFLVGGLLFTRAAARSPAKSRSRPRGHRDGCGPARPPAAAGRRSSRPA